jgi:hypothetical protein
MAYASILNFCFILYTLPPPRQAVNGIRAASSEPASGKEDTPPAGKWVENREILVAKTGVDVLY